MSKEGSCNCVAAIQYDIEEDCYVLVSGNNRVTVPQSKELDTFVHDAPDLSLDIVAALKDAWFPDAEFEEIEEVVSV